MKQKQPCRGLAPPSPRSCRMGRPRVSRDPGVSPQCVSISDQAALRGGEESREEILLRDVLLTENASTMPAAWFSTSAQHHAVRLSLPPPRDQHPQGLSATCLPSLPACLGSLPFGSHHWRLCPEGFQVAPSQVPDIGFPSQPLKTLLNRHCIFRAEI